MLPPTTGASSSSSADASVPRSDFAFDFDVERKAVERAATAAAAAAATTAKADDDAAPSSSPRWTPPDPWAPLFERHSQGEASSRVEVALALAAALAARAGEGNSESTIGEEELEKTLEPLRQLTQMGFDPKQSLGALVISKGDLASATDACLAAAASSGARI